MMCLVATIACGLLIGSQVAEASVAQADPIAVISLFNPTAWDGPALVEVPVGRIAAPGMLDWRRVRLCAGRTGIPFSLREGRAHWQARLVTPLRSVRAEDLLVFACTVPPGEWRRVEVRVGAPAAHNALSRKGNRVTVTYKDVRAVIDEKTGALVEFEAFGKPLLAGLFQPIVHRLAEKGYQTNGQMGIGHQSASISVDEGAAVSSSVRLVSHSTSAAMTELNYVITPDVGPAMALTYRLYAFGALEIALDERPWQGVSPWLDHSVRTELSLLGTERHLPLLEGRPPYWGFKDYSAAIRETACLHAIDGAGVLELGDETVNGRRFCRRLFAIAGSRLSRADDLAEIADEGLVVDVKPVCTGQIGSPIVVRASEESPPAAAKLLKDGLKEAGFDVAGQPVSGPAFAIGLRIANDAESEAVNGDGFSIVRGPKAGVEVRSRTKLGLWSAARAITRHLKRFGKPGGVPLIARNPVVNLRAGGFGGGDFEVDFPYGEDREWQQAFEGLLDSGMNVFTCLGMWGNWKMPVGFRHMPELRSDDPNAYDESSGAKFPEMESHRERGLGLARYLQERGAAVWLWIPIGCVPTTFSKRFPEAMAPGSDKIPCFTHSEYKRYVDAFLRELVETYPLQGIVLIRDDNGGICSCDRCKDYVAKSRTKSPVWEQYLIIYDWLRANGFTGAVAVYPYWDYYEPKMDPLLPKDLFVVGHGSGAAILSRDYEHVAPMGDPWLDNLYANFRVTPSPRMRRLLCDRGSFWIGGAYCGTELPWESIGYFGWEPTATPNTLRYDWGARELGKAGAVPFTRMSDEYEHLWDINGWAMDPGRWMKLSPEERADTVSAGLTAVKLYGQRLAELKQATPLEKHARWFGHLDLFATFFEYHLRRLDRFATVYDLVRRNRDALYSPEGLPSNVRDSILSTYAGIYDWAAKYDAAMQKAPDGMLSRCKGFVKPYNEWIAGYDQWLDSVLDIHQFAGAARMEAQPQSLRAGEPFTLKVELHNQGVCPWVAGTGQRIEFSADSGKLGLPLAWDYEGDPMAPGDRRTIELNGTVPKNPGEARLSMVFLAPFRMREEFIKCQISLAWR